MKSDQFKNSMIKLACTCLVFLFVGCVPKVSEPTLTVPQYLDLAEMGQTYQIIPEYSGPGNPVFTYQGEMPGSVEVSEDGLLTVVGGSVGRVWVYADDEEAGVHLAQYIEVNAWNARATLPPEYQLPEGTEVETPGG